MEWKDKGLILGVRRHGETSAILEVMTKEHGRHMGLVRGGRSTRMRPILQVGNSLDLVWRARLDEHLGTFQVESDFLRAAQIMEQPLGIHGLQTIASHLRLLPEREANSALYEAAQIILDNLDEPQKAARLLIRFELALLEELGFGLDLAECAATGTKEDLVWVSPKSGRAVSASAGKPYEKQLLALPEFLISNLNKSEVDGFVKPLSWHLESGFNLAYHFLDRHCYIPRGLTPPQERAGFIKRIMRALEVEPAA